MKTVLFAVFALSFSTLSSAETLKCELFKNDSLIRQMAKNILGNELVVIDLGPLEEFHFGGYASNGSPGTLIVGPWKSSRSNTATDSVVSYAGSILTVTCQISSKKNAGL